MEDSTRTVRKWVERVWNGGELDLLDRLHPPRFMNEGQLSTLEEAKAWHREMRATFPDIHYTIEDLLEADDGRVVVRWTASGTQRGELWGRIPPTGRRVSWRGIHILTLRESQITEVWAVSNIAAIGEQLDLEIRLPGR